MYDCTYSSDKCCISSHGSGGICSHYVVCGRDKLEK